MQPIQFCHWSSFIFVFVSLFPLCLDSLLSLFPVLCVSHKNRHRPSYHTTLPASCSHSLFRPLFLIQPHKPDTCCNYPREFTVCPHQLILSLPVHLLDLCSWCPPPPSHKVNSTAWTSFPHFEPQRFVDSHFVLFRLSVFSLLARVSGLVFFLWIPPFGFSCLDLNGL